MDIDQPEIGSAPKRRGRPPRMTPVEAKSAPVSVVTPTIARSPIREEVRTRNRKSNNSVDRFAIPAHMIPAGLSVEWKVETVLGQPIDPREMVDLHDNGWRPVDVSMMPSLMPAGYKGVIRNGGQVLMERPMELTKEAESEAYQNAQREIRIKEHQLRGAGGPFNERTPGTIANTRISKTIVPGAIPE